MIIQRFDLNLIPESVPVIVNVDQYDIGTGRLVATLYDGDDPYYPTNALVEIQGSKSDRKCFAYDATLAGNVVTANVTEQMTAVAGDTRAQIVVTESTGRTGSFVFILRVQRSALPENPDMSESDLELIEQGIEAAEHAEISAGVAKSWAVGPSAEETSGSDTNNAKYWAEQAEGGGEDAEAWAVGQRGGVDVPSTDPTYHNNSKYYAEESEDEAEESEAWAVGKRNGTDVGSSDPTYHNNSKYYAGEAGDSATAADLSAQNADSSAEDSEAYAVGKRDGTDVPSTDPAYHNNAKYYSEEAESSASDSEAYAVGKRSGTDVPTTDPAYHNNSKYYKGLAGDSATDAAASEAAADQSAEDSEAYAVGKRDGVDVPSTDATYHNNSKYYSEQAGSSAHDAAVSETNAGASETAAAASERNAAASESAAATSESNSEAWAVGQRDGVDVPSTDDTYQNNSKYYAGRAGSYSGSATDMAIAATQAKNAAQQAATTATTKAGEATNASTAAQASELAAKSSEDLAKSYAVGTNGSARAGDATDNAKYYSEQSAASASTASTILTDVRAAGTNAVSAIENALDIAAPNFVMNLATGHLMYDGGRFDFEVNNAGHLMWGLTV